jgi:UDP-N-acetylmuramoyl-L-alanyl-D-glutamate--2,6-diaminopimelate ligase
MTLLQLLDGIPVMKILQISYGKMVQTEDVTIQKIGYDSRSIEKGDVFVAIRGQNYDGHRFVEDAVHQGARVVVLENDAAVPDSFLSHNDVIKVVVGNSRRALALMSANYYGRPGSKLKILGVTGTNGKTTTTHLLQSILETAGEKTGLLGTVEYRIGDEVIPSPYTTPESLELHGLFNQMVNQSCRAVVMEVSSHALALDRVYGLRFRLALFTNLTQDHLDFHGSMDRYFNAKKSLFDGLDGNSVAVTNVDDERGLSIVASTKARRVTYGVEKGADVTAKEIKIGIEGIQCTLEYETGKTTIRSPLTGRFNVYNLLSAAASALALGIPASTIQTGIEKVKSVRGRFERIDSGKGWSVIIDYAHTPDALRKTLEAIRELLPKEKPGRIITIFGCGGNRDRAKRPQMGRIATELSDVTIITSDNPRNENPQAIIEEIRRGVRQNTETMQMVDRREAIHTGLKMARQGDVVLVAGKGHETYQVLGDKRIHFDDREEVEQYFRST